MAEKKNLNKIEASHVFRKRLGSGNWLCLEELSYPDSEGKMRVWESVMRLHGKGAVVVIAILKPSNRILLVRQFRPPAGGYVLEFPAGLLDKGETPESGALREFMEETGYTGKVVHVTPPLYSSPGMSGETVNLVFMEADENLPENRIPKTAPDEGEEIETILVPLEKLTDFLKKACKNGDLLDEKLAGFAAGITFRCRNG